jgi:hypothetical protein
VYGPGVTADDGKNDSPEPVRTIVKFAVWSVLVESKTFHVAFAVMSTEPGWAVALKITGFPPLLTLWELGVTTIEVTLFKTTETVVEPVQAEHPPDDAVMVAEPSRSPSTMPEVWPTDTVDASEEDHTTPEVSVF